MIFICRCTIEIEPRNDELHPIFPMAYIAMNHYVICYISHSFHIEGDLIMVTVFLLILSQMEFHLFQNLKGNCHHDHILFNVKGNRNLVFSVYTFVKGEQKSLWAHPAQARTYATCFMRNMLA